MRNINIHMSHNNSWSIRRSNENEPGMLKISEEDIG